MRPHQEHGDLHQVANLVDGRSMQHVGDEPVAMRRHGDQIDVSFVGDANQLVGRIAFGQQHVDASVPPLSVPSDALEIGAVGLHFLRLAQVQPIEVAGRPAVGDVHEQQFGAREARQVFRVRQDGRVCCGMLERDKNAAIHRRRFYTPTNVW